MGLDGILGMAGEVGAVRCVDRGHVDEEKHALRIGMQPLHGQVHLALGGMAMPHAQRRMPMAFREHPGKHPAQRVLLVEETHAADADGAIAACAQALGNVFLVEDEGGARRGLAAAKGGGEQPRMRARPGRRRQVAGEERVVRRVGEVARRMPLLPPLRRQMPREHRQLAALERRLRHVVAQGVQRDHHDVVGADHPVHVDGFVHRIAPSPKAVA